METTYRKLSPRQAEAPAHRTRGLSNREATQAMYCSVTKVNNLLSECFHDRNSVEATAKAIKHALLTSIVINASPRYESIGR